MHKHRTKCHRTDRRMADANHRLSSRAKSAIMEILKDITIPTEPRDSHEFALQYLSGEYLSKYCDEKVVPATTRRENAIRKFLECEARNKETNSLLPAIDPEFNILDRVTWSRFVRFCRRLTRDILGPLRDELVLGSFSGGASTSRRRTCSHPANKFIGLAHTTEAAAKYVDLIHRQSELLRQYGSFYALQEVSGSVLFTVPKKTDIDRCACKEPDINMFLQKGVGAHIRGRLRRYGIDLNDQSRNRQLAQEASTCEGGAVTLDLSSASDTISIEAVRTLLPTDWFLYLNDIRSHDVSIDGEIYRMEMFSSMGNGFTFELESLLFFVLCRATQYFLNTPGITSVYGDDLIVPYELRHDIITVLQRFGFVVNMEKSCFTGSFRESCGGHYLDGYDVTPFYLKRPPERLTDLIRVANQLRQWALTDRMRTYWHPWAFQRWKTLRDLVPKSLWGGCDYSVDTQLVSPHSPVKRLTRVKGKIEISELGSMLHWHNTNWNRGTPTEESGYKPESTIQTCRLRPAKPGIYGVVIMFHEELVDVAESYR